MNDAVCCHLHDILRANGPGLCSTPRMLGVFLRQRCPEFAREIHVLVAALEQNVNHAVQEDPVEANRAAQADSLSKNDPTLSAAEARWAVDTWTVALHSAPAEPRPATAPGAAPEDSRPALASGIRVGLMVGLLVGLACGGLRFGFPPWGPATDEGWAAPVLVGGWALGGLVIGGPLGAFAALRLGTGRRETLGGLVGAILGAFGGMLNFGLMSGLIPGLPKQPLAADLIKATVALGIGVAVGGLLGVVQEAFVQRLLDGKRGKARDGAGAAAEPVVAFPMPR